jgi:RNA polymerase sigma-70 factor (ECF subfamily)
MSALGRLVEAESVHLREYLAARLPAFLRRRVGISDIIQQTAVKLLQMRERFENRGHKAFHRMLYLIARRTLLNTVKRECAGKRDVRRQEGLSSQRARAAAERLASSTSKDETPSKILGEVEDLKHVMTCFSRLGSMDQEAIRLFDHEQLSHEVVARQLGISPGAARKRYSRAMERLRHLYLHGASRDRAP